MIVMLSGASPSEATMSAWLSGRDPTTSTVIDSTPVLRSTSMLQRQTFAPLWARHRHTAMTFSLPAAARIESL
ncbi:hypothetical protein DIE07_15505 [Burkholderia sp. Bp9002]|nr:hypothetical protein DIE07_15505 [Burkholderia sp. Bp9002]